MATAAELIAAQDAVVATFSSTTRFASTFWIWSMPRDSTRTWLSAGVQTRVDCIVPYGAVLAAIQGRNFVLPDDVKRMAFPVLGHRMILKPESRLRKN